MKQQDEKTLLQRMATYCAKRECCVQEIQQRLNSLGALPDQQQRILDYLIQERYIDESRFSKGFVHDKHLFHHWGRVKIGYELKKRGIPSSIRQEALSTLDEEEYLRHLSTLIIEKQRATRAATPQHLFEKLYRYTIGKGYEPALITSCLRQQLKTDRDDETME